MKIAPTPATGQCAQTPGHYHDDVTLYAHWAKKNDTVRVTFQNTTGAKLADANQDGTANDVNVTLAKGEALADWMKPVDKTVNWQDVSGTATGTVDGQVLSGFVEHGKTDAYDFSKPVDASVKIDVKYDAAKKVALSIDGHRYLAETTGTVDVPDSISINYAGSHANHRPSAYSYEYVDAANAIQTVTDWTNGSSLADGRADAWYVLTPTAWNDDVEVFKVNFQINYQGAQWAEPNPAPVYVDKGSSIPLPEVDTKDGLFEFDGWYTNTARTNPYNYEDVETLSGLASDHSYTLRASVTYTSAAVTVTFDPDYTGTKPTEVKAKAGDPVAWQEAPARDGYVFQGWALKDGDANANNDKFYRDAKSFEDVTASDGDTYVAKWLTEGQDQVRGLLDLPYQAYKANKARDAYAKAVNAIKTKLGLRSGSGTNYTYAPAESLTGVNGLAKLNAKTTDAYVKQLAELKDKLVTRNAPFKDANTFTPHYGAIELLSDKGISTGYADGTYGPTGSMFRQDFAAFLYRVAGSPEYTPAAADNKFSDVNASTPHYKEILWAAKNGIINGYPDGTFHGTGLVNRQDAAAMLYRLAGEPEFDEAKAAKTFTDVNAATAHNKAVLWAANTVVSDAYTNYYEGNPAGSYNGAIIAGFPAGTFDGSATLLRQDGAAFLARMYAYLNK